MSHCKSAISIMYAGTADGNLLPPYVCYKSAHISSHLPAQVIKSCEENDISFIFLPQNSTHFMQPLDVSVFRPLKRVWKQILEERKRACKGRASGIPKDIFPMLLEFLHDADNLKSGFEKCGLCFVLNKEKFAFLPSTSGESFINDESMSSVNESLVSVLQNMRYDDGSKSQRGKRKKIINVEQGKSVGVSDLASTFGKSTSFSKLPEEGYPEEENDKEDDTKIGVNDFVIFSYEGELFPGQVTAIDSDDEMFDIRAMVKSGFNWRWPKHDDIMFCPFTDVNSKIKPPHPRKRGVFSVPELEHRWGI